MADVFKCPQLLQFKYWYRLLVEYTTNTEIFQPDSRLFTNDCKPTFLQHDLILFPFHITVVSRMHTFLFGTKSLLSVRPYNIHNFKNNIRGKPYRKTGYFWLCHGFEFTVKHCVTETTSSTPALFRGLFFKRITWLSSLLQREKDSLGVFFCKNEL